MGKGSGAKPYRGNIYPDFFTPNTGKNFPFHKECMDRAAVRVPGVTKKNFYSMKNMFVFYIYYPLLLLIKSIFV